MEVDYEIYAEGEALLGWLNCTVQLNHSTGFDANDLLKQLASALQTELQRTGGEIAHLKMTLSPDEGLGEIAVINLVRNDFVPELSQTLEEPVASAQVILNLRAEAAPEVLKAAVESAVTACRKAIPGLGATIDHLEHFRPGKPQPTHRIERMA